VRAAWPTLAFVEVDTPGADVVTAGVKRPVMVRLAVSPLTVDDLTVQLVHGAIDSEGEFVGTPETLVLLPDLAATNEDGTITYVGTYEVDVAGPHGCAVRAFPTHPLLGDPFELGLVVWA